MEKVILFEDVQAAANVQQKAEERQDIAAQLEEIVSTEEGAGALLRCVVEDYGVQEAVVSLFSFLSDEEQQRLIEKAFPKL